MSDRKGFGTTVALAEPHSLLIVAPGEETEDEQFAEPVTTQVQHTRILHPGYNWFSIRPFLGLGWNLIRDVCLACH